MLGGERRVLELELQVYELCTVGSKDHTGIMGEQRALITNEPSLHPQLQAPRQGILRLTEPVESDRFQVQ